MSWQKKIKKVWLTAGISRSSFGLGFNISKYGVDVTLICVWASIEF